MSKCIDGAVNYPQKIKELEQALEITDKHYDMLAEENEKLRLKVERLEAERRNNMGRERKVAFEEGITSSFQSLWTAYEDLKYENKKLKAERTNHIVQVKHINDPYSEGYIFNVPEGKELKKDDFVLCETKGGTPSVARCITDSKWVDDDVLKMIMRGKKVISRILGKYELKECDTE